MAALGKVSEGPHSSTDCQLLDLQEAGLQRCANTLGPKSWWRGWESNPGLPLTAVALHSELLNTPVTMYEETLTDDSSA